MEAWDVYDIHRDRTGEIVYRGNPLPEGKYHLAVDIWIMNANGEILVQQRSLKKDSGAGLWCCTGGAAIAGEDSVMACRRETMEELGIIPDMNQARIVLQSTLGSCHKDVWLIRQNIAPEAFHLQPEEVDKVRWVTIEQLEREMENHSLFWKLHYMESILICLKEAAGLKGGNNE